MVTSGKNDSNRFRFLISQLIVVYGKCFPSESYQQTRSMFSGRRSQTQDRLTLTLVRHHITQHCQSSTTSSIILPSTFHSAIYILLWTSGQATPQPLHYTSPPVSSNQWLSSLQHPNNVFVLTFNMAENPSNSFQNGFVIQPDRAMNHKFEPKLSSPHTTVEELFSISINYLENIDLF